MKFEKVLCRMSLSYVSVLVFGLTEQNTQWLFTTDEELANRNVLIM